MEMKRIIQNNYITLQMKIEKLMMNNANEDTDTIGNEIQFYDQHLQTDNRL